MNGVLSWGNTPILTISAPKAEADKLVVALAKMRRPVAATAVPQGLFCQLPDAHLASGLRVEAAGITFAMAERGSRPRQVPWNQILLAVATRVLHQPDSADHKTVYYPIVRIGWPSFKSRAT